MLRTDDHGRVRLLTLDRPEALNAFNTELYDTVAAALDEAATDGEVAVVVLTGSGRAFSAGQDLAEMATLASSMGDGGDGSGGGHGSGHGFPGSWTP